MDNDEMVLRASAQRLIKNHGYEGALLEAAKHRDSNSWGTFSFAHHNAVLKMIHSMKEEYAA